MKVPTLHVGVFVGSFATMDLLPSMWALFPLAIAGVSLSVLLFAKWKGIELDD